MVMEEEKYRNGNGTFRLGRSFSVVIQEAGQCASLIGVEQEVFYELA